MGILVEQIIRDMNEAMVMEGLGAHIDLVPNESTVEQDETDEQVWLWTLNVFHKVPITVYFYVDIAGELTHTMVLQDTLAHEVTKIQQTVLEEAYEWLYAEGAFDGS